jgi:hypothetical protein
MERCLFFKKDVHSIGLFTRTATNGEEYKLVEQFIDYYCHHFLRNNKNTNLAVFIEPRIISGYPDIVFATYSPSIADVWSEKRSHLSIPDLKILSHIIATKGINGKEIMTSLRMPEKQVLISLEMLIDSNLIDRKNGTWKPGEIKSVFSIKKLVAVEAKINDMSRVIEQSYLNTWFSSHSYVLTNRKSLKESTIQNFEKRGIGLYGKSNQFMKVIEAKKLPLPSSYLSLQFNEWIGRALTISKVLN